MDTKKNEWFGIDASKEISLFEYGLLVKEIEPGSYEVIYGTETDKSNYIKFDTGTITNIEANNLTKESWFDRVGFLSFLGMTSEGWYDSFIANKLYDLLSYYGYQNIFGISYGGFLTIKEVSAKAGLHKFNIGEGNY